jgi:hypothetical protein
MDDRKLFRSREKVIKAKRKCMTSGSIYMMCSLHGKVVCPRAACVTIPKHDKLLVMILMLYT